MFEEIFSVELAKAANNTTQASRLKRWAVFLFGRRVKSTHGRLSIVIIEWKHKSYLYKVTQI